MTDLEQLRDIIAIADNTSIAAAARHRGLSASQLSRRVAALEQALGTKLIVRTTRHLSLTIAGEAWLHWARETLLRHDRLLDDLAALDGEPRGLVRIACQIFGAHQYLLEVLARFRQQHPDLRFQITVTDEPARLVSEQGYDLAVQVGPAPEGPFVTRRIRSYRRVVCASPAYLRQHGVPAHPRDLSALHALLHDHIEPHVWHFRTPGGALISQPMKAAMRANSTLLLRDLAIGGLGVIRAAEGVVREALASGQLVPMLEDFPPADPPGRQAAIWLVYPARKLPFRVRFFEQALAEHLEAAAAAGPPDN
jgi:DNA-binding transcriptional LysR family regulator